MKKISEEEMLKIEGGALTGTVLNAVYKIIEIIYSVGESLGSYIRRKASGKMCDI